MTLTHSMANKDIDDWLADIENAATLVEENEVIVAKGKARGLVQDLIKNMKTSPGPTLRNNFATA